MAARLSTLVDAVAAGAVFLGWPAVDPDSSLSYAVPHCPRKTLGLIRLHDAAAAELVRPSVRQPQKKRQQHFPGVGLQVVQLEHAVGCRRISPDTL